MLQDLGFLCGVWEIIEIVVLDPSVEFFIRSLCGIFYLIPLWNSILLEVNKLLQDLDFLCGVWETLVLVVLGSLLCTLIFVFLIANLVL